MRAEVQYRADTLNPTALQVVTVNAARVTVEAAADRECERFWQLWIERREYLLKLCLKWLRGSRADAEEVLSAGAIKAIEYLRARPNSVRNLFPWISRILYNLCIDVLRERSRVIPLDDSVGEPRPTRGSRRARTFDAPDHGVHRDEIAHAIEVAVGALPPKLYAVFMLRFVEELPYREISVRLAITPQNARKRIQQARQLLREELRQHSTARGVGARRSS